MHKHLLPLFVTCAIATGALLGQCKPAAAVWVTPNENCGTPETCPTVPCVTILVPLPTGDTWLTTEAVPTSPSGVRWDCDGPIASDDNCCEKVLPCSTMRFYTSVPCPGGETGCDGGCEGTPWGTNDWPTVSCFFGDPSMPQCH